MSGKQLMKLVGVRYRTGAGTCGIEPHKGPQPPPPPPPVRLPDHLIRPPCRDGQELNLELRSCSTPAALYCPPQKIKYRYPPFSDNIDFVPTGDVDCWWAGRAPASDPDADDDSPAGF